MDALSCDLLSRRLNSSPDLSFLEKFRHRNSIVVGDGPGIENDVKSLNSGTVIVAGSAIVRYYRRMGPPDILVTDLDDDNGLTGQCASEGTVVLVHAHGDNIPMIKNLSLPENSKVIGTCQCEPTPNTMNFGGFTDGDRAVFLADYLDSPRIELMGFDFSNVDGEPEERRKVKLRKLKMAEYLIGELKASRVDTYGKQNIVIL